jgi:serine phosphatase RsbU (regulator of sigma subunit)
MAVIGDVVGHDGSAATAMAHVRDILRGIAQADRRPPAALLSDLDQALRRLSLPTLASVVVVTITPRWHDSVVCWSNAGHPPPLLIPTSRPAELLHTTPELLVGVDPNAARTDHEITLRAGDTLLLYTDGLVERHDADLDDGLATLRSAAEPLGRAPLAELTDRLLAAIPGPRLDDIALLARRARSTHTHGEPRGRRPLAPRWRTGRLCRHLPATTETDDGLSPPT